MYSSATTTPYKGIACLVSSYTCMYVYNTILFYYVAVPNYSNLLPGFGSCHFNGIKYSIGETFHPTVKVNNTSMEDICASCTCYPVSGLNYTYNTVL